MDVEVRARSLPPPKYPHAAVVSAVEGASHVVSLIGASKGRFLVRSNAGVTAIAAGNALTSRSFRRRLPDWLAEIGRDGIGAAVRRLKASAATSFALVVLLADRIVVFGDVFGTLPLFYSADGRIAGTNPDSIGLAVGARYDPVSFADMTVTTRVCHPHTLYEGVFQLSPTAWLELSGGGVAVHESGYRPPAIGHGELVDSAGDRLERILADHLHDRRALVAISGGLDSRILASIAARLAETRSFSVTDAPSRDATIGALAARHRGIPHEMIVLERGRFAPFGSRVVEGATSQNLALHAHFVPVGDVIAAAGDVLVGGYGANANFERYDGLETVLGRIDASDHPAATKAELRRRWLAHRAFVADILGLDPEWLASTWPGTHKKAFAFVHSNRRLMASLDPFLLLPEMFAAKARLGRNPSQLALHLFRRFCADEAHLPTTRPNHPLESAAVVDPSADEQGAGWPGKDFVFHFAAGERYSRRLARLRPMSNFFFRQMCAVELVWHRGGEPAGLATRLARRILR